jgi:hypothetical protein
VFDDSLVTETAEESIATFNRTLEDSGGFYDQIAAGATHQVCREAFGGSTLSASVYIGENATNTCSKESFPKSLQTKSAITPEDLKSYMEADETFKTFETCMKAGIKETVRFHIKKIGSKNKREGLKEDDLYAEISVSSEMPDCSLNAKAPHYDSDGCLVFEDIPIDNIGDDQEDRGDDIFEVILEEITSNTSSPLSSWSSPMLSIGISSKTRHPSLS